MNNLKSILVIFLGFVCLHSVAAQEVSPEPVGGISAIMKNVVYPESAVKANIQGKVVLEATVTENGDVEDVIILKSVNADVDQAAITALKKTKFKPGTMDGQLVKSKVTVPFQFKLNEDKKKE